MKNRSIGLSPGNYTFYVFWLWLYGWKCLNWTWHIFSTCYDLVLILQKRSSTRRNIWKSGAWPGSMPMKQPWTKGGSHCHLVPCHAIIALLLWTLSSMALCLSFKQVFCCGHEHSTVLESFKGVVCANNCCLQTFSEWWADYATYSKLC